MLKSYPKSEIQNRLSQYFKDSNCKNLYKDSCINYVGVTKDTNENYSKVIVDYLVEHIEVFKKELNKIGITRKTSYKIDSHTGMSDFDFNARPKGERREEKIAHAMYCQYKEKAAAFGTILDYQIPLKNTSKDSGVGKIDLISSKTYKTNNEQLNKLYILELKKDNSKETLLRCILEAYTYYNIVNREKLCMDFGLYADDTDFVISPLVFKSDKEFQKDLKDVLSLINALKIPVEIFAWEYISGKYKIESMQQ